MAVQPEPLLELLDLTADADGWFRAPPPRAWLARVFGGQLLAQGLWAACRRMEQAQCHSLHARFLRGGQAGHSLEYHVQPMHEGRTLAVCSVTAKQRHQTKLVMTVSFERDELRGLEHQQPAPEAPPPESFGDEAARTADLLARLPAEYHEHILRQWAFEWITVDEFDFRESKPAPKQIRTWMRARGPLPNDPNLHRCALAYASDMVVLDPSLQAIGTDFGRPDTQIASLDHAMWFHRSGRADDWVLLVCDSPSVAGGRGFNRGSIYDRQGRLLASIAQEALVRTLVPQSPPA